MCGISGVLSREPKESKLALVRRMSDSIKHRGPNGEGYWINEGGQIAFGHRRLAIIDLTECGRQPMTYANGRYTIVFNGEIYNYIELRSFLIERNYSFKSKTDTEIILAMYDLKGVRCLQEFNGMFAFAIWDEQEKSLFCARDRFGEKPFFYSYVPGKSFYFASEMKALWSAGIPKRLDEQKAYNFFASGSIAADANETFYKDINQLENGHYLLINNFNDLVVKKYYSLNEIHQNNEISEREAASQLFDILLDSVKLRLRSDVSVGSSLSGGLDSSTIVKLIDNVKEPGVIQKTFSARFHGFVKDEGYYIHKVLQSCGNIQSHEVWPDHSQLMEEIDDVIYYQEEPFTSPSVFAQWKVMQLARSEDVTVLLDGQGADEYLAGYLYYYELYINELFYNHRSIYHTEVEKYNSLRSPIVFSQRQTARQRIGRLRRRYFGQQVPYLPGAFRTHLRNDTMVFGLKGLLRYADRNSMAHSREVRLPFLDHRLVEFVFSLPDNFLLRDGWTKWILRESISQLLPNEVAWRIEKVGFEPPETDWLSKILTNKARRRVYEYFRDNSIVYMSKNDVPDKDWNIFMLSKMIN